MAFNYNGTDLPYEQFSREGNAAQWLNDYFKKTFNRNPTQDEISQFLPAYLGSDKNITDTAQGNAAVSRYHQQLNPNEAFQKNAKEHYGTVDQAFQQFLNRPPTDQERDHFGSLMASGQYTAYDLGNMLQNLPENIKKQDEEFRKGLTTDLREQDSRYFNEKIMPGISQNFSRSGRSFDSSAYAQALAQAAQGQNRDRESFLSNLTASQYEGNKASASADYWKNMDYMRGRSDTVADRNLQRLYDLENYNMQKQAYDQYMARYGKKNQLVEIINGMFAGGKIGASTGNPYAAAGGAAAGGVLGGISANNANKSNYVS